MKRRWKRENWDFLPSWSCKELAESPMTLTPLFFHSALNLATAPNSVVHTGAILLQKKRSCRDEKKCQIEIENIGADENKVKKDRGGGERK